MTRSCPEESLKEEPSIQRRGRSKTLEAGPGCVCETLRETSVFEPSENESERRVAKIDHVGS